MLKEIIVKDKTQLPEVAGTLLSLSDKSKIIAFSGELGSGKTTIIGELCNKLGVNDQVSSPTFSIVNEYYSPLIDKLIFHIDLYRLKNEEEIWNAGIEEYIKGSSYTFIEWPEKIRKYLPAETLFTIIDLEESSKYRKITIFKL